VASSDTAVCGGEGGTASGPAAVAGPRLQRTTRSRTRDVIR
jgi:hypothetical protein